MRFPYPWTIPFIFILENTLSKKADMVHSRSTESFPSNEPRELQLRRHKSSHNFHDPTVAQGRLPPAYSPWGVWSACWGGRRRRRRHCIRPEVCYDRLRLESARCGRGTGVRGGASRGGRHHQQPDDNKQFHANILTVMPASHMQRGEDIQKRFRGFSPWSKWSKCSRRCTTVRRRQCRRRALCGRKVIRESAYCYLDGSYCQRWIRNRMQKRRNSDNYVVENMSEPITALHKEDTRKTPQKDPPCGRLNTPQTANLLQKVVGKKWPMLRIIGGRPAPRGKWPWQVVVLNRFKEAFCGGTLVSLRWVVTAAHCVRKRLFVRLGEHDLRVRGPGEVELRISEAIIHPLYDPDTVDNDVAMLRLPSPARPELGHGIACLPRPHQMLPPHTACTILGWGKRSVNDEYGSNLLQEAQVSTVSQGICRRVYWEYAITDNMVCAGRGRRDSCAGDSGGPLLCRQRDGEPRYFLQGITSFGDGCGKRGKYGIYTRTSNYVPWMLHILSKQYFDD